MDCNEFNDAIDGAIDAVLRAAIQAEGPRHEKPMTAENIDDHQPFSSLWGVSLPAEMVIASKMGKRVAKLEDGKIGNDVQRLALVFTIMAGAICELELALIELGQRLGETFD